MFCLSFKRTATRLSEVREVATNNVSALLSEESLRLSGHDVALDVYYMFLDYTLCRDEGNSVEGIIALLAHLAT